jgi:hypothetical protein
MIKVFIWFYVAAIFFMAVGWACHLYNVHPIAMLLIALGLVSTISIVVAIVVNVGSGDTE